MKFIQFIGRALRRPSRRTLLATIERQAKLLNDPKLIDLELEPGGALRMDLEHGFGAKVLAASFADMIAGAPNWASFEVGPFPTPDQGKLIVTVRRLTGESPESQVRKLKEELAEAEKDKAELEGIYEKVDTQVFDTLKTIGEDPGPPAGWPDRIDMLCEAATEMHADAVELEKMIDENRGLICKLRAIIDRYADDDDSRTTLTDQEWAAIEEARDYTTPA